MNLIKKNGIDSPSINNNSFNNNFISSFKHNDINNTQEMNDKAFRILQERLNRGLITMEEFNKKCNQLRKK